MEFIELKEFSLKVSRDGHVVSTITGKEKKQTPDRYGYQRVYEKDVHGKRRGYFVHRLMAIAFIPNPEGKKFVNHINGIKTDYSLGNLEWCTHQENIQHAHRTGLNDSSSKGRTKIMRNRAIRDLKKIGYTHDDIAEVFGVSQVNITRILKLKRNL